MTLPTERPPAREAPTELLVLSQFEEFTSWLLDRTRRWPKAARFTLTQRVENHLLDVVEQLVVARYRPRDRAEVLDHANLRLERMRHLLRLACRAGVCPHRTFENAMRQIDETGRMLHGWRASCRDRSTRRGAPA